VRRPLRLLALLVTVAGWNVALLAAPLGDPPQLSAVTYLAASLVCHQQPDRSFHLAGAQVPVCARCLGLYAGAFVGVVGWTLMSGWRTTPRRTTRALLAAPLVRTSLIVAALPTLLSVALAWLGLWDSSNAMRAVLALPLGAIAAAVVAAVAAGDLR
jgi:uncharacterized membrane protein